MGFDIFRIKEEAEQDGRKVTRTCVRVRVGWGELDVNELLDNGPGERVISHVVYGPSGEIVPQSKKQMKGGKSLKATTIRQSVEQQLKAQRME